MCSVSPFRKKINNFDEPYFWNEKMPIYEIQYVPKLTFCLAETENCK